MSKKAKTQVQETQVQEQAVQAKIDLLTEKIAQVEALNAQKIANLEKKVKANNCYDFIANFCAENSLETKALSKEFNKQYIKKAGRNIVFVLYKSNNIVSLYTNYSLSSESAYSTYNKSLCYRTNLTFEQLRDNFAEIIETSEKNLGNKVTGGNTLVSNLKAEIEALKAQLGQ